MSCRAQRAKKGEACSEHLTPAASLPAERDAAVLVGRAWVPGDPPGPSVVAIQGEDLVDLSRARRP